MSTSEFIIDLLRYYISGISVGMFLSSMFYIVGICINKIIAILKG